MKFLTILFSVLICFSAKAQFVVNGDAYDDGAGCYTLTDNEIWLAGSIWYDTLISLNNDFKVDFSFKLGDFDEGADGIAFVLQPVSTGLGSSGGGIGYEGIEPSLNIEFDTYNNSINNDPPYDHISIMRDGQLNHAMATAIAPYQYIIAGEDNVEDGILHDGSIIWDPAVQTISVYVDCDLRISYTGDIVEEIFDGNPNVYMGFTSATGGLSNEHKVCFNYLTAVDELVDIDICEGDTVSLFVPDEFASITWEPNYNISNPLINNPQVWPEVTTTYTVTMTDECGFSITDEVEITISDFEIDLGADTVFCLGYYLSPGAGLGTYLWSTGETTDSIQITDPGTYWVQIAGPEVCATADTIQIIDVFDLPVIDFPDDAGFCEGNGLVIDAGGGYTAYEWNTGSTAQSITVLNEAVYTCTVFDEWGCAASDSIYIEVYPAPLVDLGFPVLYLCNGETELLSAFNPGASYEWNDGSTLSSFLADTAGYISVVVTSEEGCIAEDELTVVSDCLDDLYFPNVFSPNQDGLNDIFKPVLFADIDDFHIQIYSRWGELIFESSSVLKGWDGTLNGVLQEMGTYVYSAIYRIGDSEQILSGTVILMY
jgi:gliding motility-associated-like protein